MATRKGVWLVTVLRSESHDLVCSSLAWGDNADEAKAWAIAHFKAFKYDYNDPEGVYLHAERLGTDSDAWSHFINLHHPEDFGEPPLEDPDCW